MKMYTSIAGVVETNCYLVWDEESRDAFLIDPGAFEPGVMEKIRNESLSLEYILLTHGHGDHIGGLDAYLKKFPEVKLAAGKKEEPLLSDASLNFSEEIAGKAVTPKPDLFLKDGDEIMVGGLKIRTIETPGHTPGGISLYIESEKALFSGDTLFWQSIGRTDLPGGDMNQIVASIRNKLFNLPEDTKVYPGHMLPTEIGYEKKHNMFV